MWPVGSLCNLKAVVWLFCVHILKAAAVSQQKAARTSPRSPTLLELPKKANSIYDHSRLLDHISRALSPHTSGRILGHCKPANLISATGECKWCCPTHSPDEESAAFLRRRRCRLIFHASLVTASSFCRLDGLGSDRSVPCADEADEGLGRGNKSPSPRTFFSNSMSGVGDGNLSMNTHGEKNMNRFIFGCENKRLWTLIMLRRQVQVLQTVGVTNNTSNRRTMQMQVPCCIDHVIMIVVQL